MSQRETESNVIPLVPGRTAQRGTVRERKRKAGKGEPTSAKHSDRSGSARTYDLSHARCEPAHCLAPGLFRSLKRGERKREKLDVVYRYGECERIEFSGPEPLGADDLRILQGLVAMAGPYGNVLWPEPKTHTGQWLRTALKPKWDAVREPALIVETTYSALARVIGYGDKGGKQFRVIQKCIERLWKVSIIAQSGDKRQGFRLLAEYSSDESDGRLVFALNPLIAQAVVGNQRYIRIQMDEVRRIKKETARLIHSRLCGWINPGGSGSISIDKLCTYLWPRPAASAATMRKRKQRIREALDEMKSLGWAVTEQAADKFNVGRPQID
ncbi:MAG: replication protein C [Nitrococcus mobilis]|nr:replication protein C [Nitrococcus mobilis]